MVDDPAPDLIQWQHIDRGQPAPAPEPQPQPAPSGDFTITFTEAELGLELVGVDHTALDTVLTNCRHSVRRHFRPALRSR